MTTSSLMFKSLLIWTVFVTGVACAGTNSLSPDAILNRCAHAMGSPQQRLDVVADGQIQGDADTGDLPSAIRFETRGLESFRQESGSGADTRIAVISHGRGSHLIEGKKKALPRHSTAYFRPDHLPALLCSASSAGGVQVTLEGESKVGDAPVFDLKFSARPGKRNDRADAIESLISEYHIFVDQQSFLVLKSSTFVFSPDAIENHSLWETYYFDYRRIGDVLMPFKLENFLAGGKVRTIVFTSIQTGVSVPDQDFQ